MVEGGGQQREAGHWQGHNGGIDLMIGVGGVGKGLHSHPLPITQLQRKDHIPHRDRAGHHRRIPSPSSLLKNNGPWIPLLHLFRLITIQTTWMGPPAPLLQKSTVQHTPRYWQCLEDNHLIMQHGGMEMNRSPRQAMFIDKVTSQNDRCLAVKGRSLSAYAHVAKLSMTMVLNKLRRIKPSLMDNEQCQGIEAGCTMNDEFPPSDGMAAAADEEDDADHRASIFATNAPLSIEPQSIAKETILNNHPLLSCNPTFEGFEAMYLNAEMIRTLTMEQQLLEAIQPLESPAPRKKKLIHRTVKVGVAMI